MRRETELCHLVTLFTTQRLHHLYWIDDLLSWSVYTPTVKLLHVDFFMECLNQSFIKNILIEQTCLFFVTLRDFVIKVMILYSILK